MSLPNYEDGADLSRYIQAAIDEFVDAREWYWQQQDDPHVRTLADITGRQLVAASVALTDPAPTSPNPEIPWEQYKIAAEHDSLRDEVLEAIQIVLAEELQSDLAGMAGRCKELAEHVFAQPPGPKVSQYIQRLTRCFIAGFLPECVMLCRAVLENAVTELFEAKGIPFPASDDGTSSMRQRLAEAQRQGWLSNQAKHDAGIVWNRGNKAIHNDVAATSDILGTIQLTTSVLTEIYGRA
jgi:hypothetical protein